MKLVKFSETIRDKVFTAIFYATDTNKADNFFGKHSIPAKRGFNRKQF